MWNLFADSNNTVSLRNVAYKGGTYQIVNHFFPFKTATIKKWEISDSDIARSLKQDDEDRFMAKWLAEQKLDPQCKELLAVAREIYKSFSRISKTCQRRLAKSSTGTQAGGRSSGVCQRQVWKRSGWRRLTS